MSFLSEKCYRYIPLQPTITSATRDVVYKEYLPALPLQHIISCYWELNTTRPLDQHFIYKVVTDGCIDIFFQWHQPEDSFVMGLCNKYTEFDLGNSFHYFGIKFLPTMFPQLFKISASELSNRFESLHHVVPNVANFVSNHFSGQYPTQSIKKVLDHYFLSLCKGVNFIEDARLYEALDIIYKNNGTLKIEADIRTGFSQRQLLRLFKHYIGDTPKTFSKIIRFQHVLAARPSIVSLRKNKIFYDAGYYDQAHFIKEFKHLYGITPTKAFAVR